MELDDILAKLKFDNLSDRAKIEGYITAAFNGSSSAELLLNQILRIFAHVQLIQCHNHP
jgi:hypothetical protein